MTEAKLPRSRIRVVGGGIAAVAAIVLAASCSDAPTGVGAAPTSDFVAEGVVYNRIWRPSASGLRLVGSGSAPTVMSRVGGKVSAKADAGTFAVADSATALRERFTPSTLLDRAISAPGSVPKVVLKARKLGTQTIDGKRVSIAAVPDADRRSGRPARAMLTIVDDRIASITEYTWAKKAGGWRAMKSRTTFLDEHGVTLVYDRDASALNYRPGSKKLGLIENIRGGAGKVVPALVQLVQPDVLYAAEDDDGTWCIQEGIKAMAAGAAVVAAGLYLVAATRTFEYATGILTAALAACMVSPATCQPALEAAILAEAAAAANLAAARTALGGATLLAAAADEALYECRQREEQRRKPPETQTGPGGGDSEGNCDGGEEWCQWTLSWGSGTLHVSRDFCWCEGGGGEWEM